MLVSDLWILSERGRSGRTSAAAILLTTSWLSCWIGLGPGTGVFSGSSTSMVVYYGIISWVRLKL